MIARTTTWMSVALILGLALGLAGCEEAVDSPEKAARKAECRKLTEHIFQITPESKRELDGLDDAARRTRLGELIARVPIEDIEQCAGADPQVIACMQKAPDQAALRTCIPPATQ